MSLTYEYSTAIAPPQSPNSQTRSILSSNHMYLHPVQQPNGLTNNDMLSQINQINGISVGGGGEEGGRYVFPQRVGEPDCRDYLVSWNEGDWCGVVCLVVAWKLGGIYSFSFLL